MHLARFKFRDEIHKIFHTSSEPIQLPDDERISFTEMRQCISKTRPLGGRPARPIGKNSLAADFSKRAALQR